MPALTNVQPVRFAKGSAIPVAEELNVAPAAATVTTTPLDMTSFEALQILVDKVGGGAVSSQRALPNVTVYGSLSTSGPWLLIDDTRADYSYPSTQTSPEIYTVGNLLPYVKIEVSSLTRFPTPGSPVSDGVWSVYAVPVVLSPKIRVEGIDGGAAVIVATNTTAPLVTLPVGAANPISSSPEAVTDVASEVRAIPFSLNATGRTRFQNVGAKTVYLAIGPAGLSAADIEAPAGPSLGKYGVRLQPNESFEMPAYVYSLSAWAICAAGDSSALAMQIL